MSIASIMRKEDFEAQTGVPQGTKKPDGQAAKDHMLLGFDGECRKPENLGTEILNMLQALPELLVLTDIKDLKNTLGLYRIAFLFEGLVQFTTPEGTKVDASQHKLSAHDADFMHKHRHEDISTTVMLKPQ
ncbi:uncharacterized protein EMH_0034900 [Eimeria mitis]|uniref:Uncharacterized protein n=1 Tax=Eimeria mitis TaxID=44415 RepID=U6JWA3_9EIME|nr:uncharacterized protein EMH_0034900 [Eimeria mitis]CDJ27798.1 hypothetical protein, conserved [Eimeria mitis]